MSRAEEAQALLDALANMSKQLDPESMNRIAMTPLLSDIAMSLAVIADSLTGEEKKDEA